MRNLIPSLCFIFLLYFLLSCESYPKDPNETLKKAREEKLRVGVMHAPPWAVVADGAVKGIEAEIIKGFAQEIQTEIEWVKGTEEELMPLLQEHELHLVIGGVTNSTPWKKHVGLTNPYKKEKVLICNTSGTALPEDIKNHKVGVKKSSAVGAYVKKKKATPVFLDSLQGYNGLIAIYESDLKKFGCNPSELEVHTAKHVIAVPKGENNFLMNGNESFNKDYGLRLLK